MKRAKNLRYKDISNQKFGRLTAIKYIGRTFIGRSATWDCICDCGNKIVVDARRLKSGNTKSCGCLLKENGSITMKRRYPNIGYGDANFHCLIYDYKRAALKRNLSWTLSNEEAKNLFKSNCYYCNLEPCNVCNKRKLKGEFIYNGIDRLDNNKGYTIENCVTCCKICNRAKFQMTEDDFKKWIKRAYQNIYE